MGGGEYAVSRPGCAVERAPGLRRKKSVPGGTLRGEHRGGTPGNALRPGGQRAPAGGHWRVKEAGGWLGRWVSALVSHQTHLAPGVLALHQEHAPSILAYIVRIYSVMVGLVVTIKI
jgi:hypothetical protein